ncbi:MAG: GGDEF domain-containing protein [Gammaproteobacteria bacterium]|nr:MAG: GGDEF domain-containing protein [Gammaproteobacteria bacterium]
MSDHSVATGQISELKKKLETAIKSRSRLEEGFNRQSSQLIQFIAKLSHVCKGIDLELDNKLANFRNLLTKSAPLAEIEIQINVVSKLLLKFASKNDSNIKELHQQFHAAGKILQKINGLPNQLRRDLRALLAENSDGKETVIQYVPPLTQLVTLYEAALKAKIDLKPEEITTQLTEKNENSASDQSDHQITTNVDHRILSKFSCLLDELSLSEGQSKQLVFIKNTLTKDISQQELIDCFIKTFDLVLLNLQNERETAESFLSSLSKTLSTVQSAVKSTLNIHDKSQKEYKKLNAQLQEQMQDVTSAVKKAASLSDIKEDINNKLQSIASTIELKAQLENKSQHSLAKQLQTMTTQIDFLEKQSKDFEIRLREQQRKSMQDALTKLNNRAAFDEHFAKEMVYHHQKDLELAIAVIDIDDFKRINDTYGHTAGDKTLQVIAKTMKVVIPKAAFIARYGGEEFVIIYRKTKKETLVKSLDTLREKIASLPFKFKKDKVTITLSIGVTHIKSEDNIHLAFERADKGLYQAKSSGKNKVIYLA